MIGKAKSNLSLAKTIDYQLKQKSELFYTNNLVGDNLEDYRMQMEDLQQCYRGYGKQLLIHAILSPTIEDGKKLDKETWAKMADIYLKELNLKENYQAMGFIHKDKEHTHAHLVISKVNMNDYKLFQDSFIGKKSQHIADKIAQQFNLTRAMEIKKENLKKILVEKENKNIIINEESPKGTRQKFKQELRQINEQWFNTPEAYFNALEENNFKVIQHFDEQHNLRGYSVKKDGTMMNATTIGKEFSLRKLGLIHNENIIAQTASQQPSTKEVQTINETIQPLTDTKLKASLYNYFKDFGIDKATVDKSSLQFIQHKNYYYAALKNNSNGYAVINPFTNENIGDKDITTIGNYQNADVIVCEDIFNYLRHLQNGKSQSTTNFIVLNEIYSAEKLKQELERIQPKQILYNTLKQQTQKQHKVIHAENKIFSKLVQNLVKTLFADEHEFTAAPAQDLHQQKKKKKKLKTNW